MPAGAAEAQLLASHEDRLQRVENQYPQLLGDVADVKTDVALLQKTTSSIEVEVKDLGRAMQDHAHASAIRQDAIMAKLTERDAAEATQKIAVDQRKALMKKAVIPVTLIGGGFFAKLGEFILQHVFHLL